MPYQENQNPNRTHSLFITNARTLRTSNGAVVDTKYTFEVRETATDAKLGVAWRLRGGRHDFAFISTREGLSSFAGSESGLVSHLNNR